jgi:hypothetical protein
MQQGALAITHLVLKFLLASATHKTESSIFSTAVRFSTALAVVSALLSIFLYAAAIIPDKGLSTVRSQTVRGRLTKGFTNLLARAAVAAIPIVLDDEAALATLVTTLEILGIHGLRGGLWRIGDLLHRCRTL